MDLGLENMALLGELSNAFLNICLFGGASASIVVMGLITKQEIQEYLTERRLEQTTRDLYVCSPKKYFDFRKRFHKSEETYKMNTELNTRDTYLHYIESNKDVYNKFLSRCDTRA